MGESFESFSGVESWKWSSVLQWRLLQSGYHLHPSTHPPLEEMVWAGVGVDYTPTTQADRHSHYSWHNAISFWLSCYLHPGVRRQKQLGQSSQRGARRNRNTDPLLPITICTKLYSCTISLAGPPIKGNRHPRDRRRRETWLVRKQHPFQHSASPHSSIKRWDSDNNSCSSAVSPSPTSSADRWTGWFQTSPLPQLDQQL